MSDGPSPISWAGVDPRATLRHIFDAAVASADPGAAVLRHLPEKPRGCCVVIGAGKSLGRHGGGTFPTCTAIDTLCPTPYLLVFSRWLDRADLGPVDKFERVAAHRKRIEDRPAVKKVLAAEA
jgi:hypothetical protein